MAGKLRERRDFFRHRFTRIYPPSINLWRAGAAKIATEGAKKHKGNHRFILRSSNDTATENGFRRFTQILFTAEGAKDAEGF